jgi:hypothetical protein
VSASGLHGAMDAESGREERWQRRGGNVGCCCRGLLGGVGGGCLGLVQGLGFEVFREFIYGVGVSRVGNGPNVVFHGKCRAARHVGMLTHARHVVAGRASTGTEATVLG